MREFSTSQQEFADMVGVDLGQSVAKPAKPKASGKKAKKDEEKEK